MSSITRLTVENFQSHQKTVVEPAENGLLTVVVGPSDSGKTAIIRALRWLLYNVPQGDDFIRVGCTLCRVTLELRSGHTVIRERSKGGINRYKVLAPGADKPEVYEGFGHTVPLEVRELTGVQPVTIGDLTLNLNMSEQLDGPFLGSAVSGGARARILGKLAGTEEVDHAAKTLGTDLHRVKQDEKRLSAEISELDEKIAEYDYLPKMAERIRQIEDCCRNAKEAQEKRNKLTVLQASLKATTQQIDEAQKIVDRWRFVELAQNETEKAMFAAERAHRLNGLRQSLTVAEMGIDEALATLHRVGILPVAELNVSDAEKDIERIKLLKDFSSRLETANRVIQEFGQRAQRLIGVPEAETLLNSSSQAVSMLAVLRNLSATYWQIIDQREKWRFVSEQYEKVDVAKELAGEAQLLMQKRNNVLDLRRKFKTADDLVWINTDLATSWEHEVSELEGAYRDALLSEGRCPTCGGEINPEKLKEVV